MTDGRCRFGPRAKHEMVARVLAGETSRQAYKAPKFLAPGHRVTGERDQNGRARGLGHTVVIAVEDDHCPWSTPNCTAPRTRSTSPSPSRAPPPGCGAGLRCGPGRPQRQRQVLHRPPVPADARRARRPPHPHPAVHAALERQARALLRRPRRRMGARAHLAKLRQPQPRAVIVHPPLQPLAPTQRRRRPITHHPHPAGP
jgi:hypothetical protein